MYVKKFVYGGFDWHDCAQYTVQLSENGNYDVQDSKKLIVTDILTKFPYLEEKMVRDAIEEEHCYEFAIKEAINENGKITYNDCPSEQFEDTTYYENSGIINGAEMKVSESYVWGQINYVTTYETEEIDEARIIYLVTEQFLCPTKGVPLIERFYHKPFRNIKDAAEFWEKMPLHPAANSRKEILIFDQKISEKEWFKLNMAAILLMEQNGQSAYDASFVKSVTLHIENLNKK